MEKEKHIKMLLAARFLQSQLRKILNRFWHCCSRTEFRGSGIVVELNSTGSGIVVCNPTEFREILLPVVIIKSPLRFITHSQCIARNP
jgi:hypothetical protein